jgi:hypothetical protein
VTDDGTGCVQPPPHHLLRDGNAEHWYNGPCVGHHGFADGALAKFEVDAIKGRKSERADLKHSQARVSA